mmetsp:Transcript_31535/g.60181  ORF Transcript_31535/g.60181 Transcript_31535/m.60181 type:complete len:87 (-) Transcript_31535:804-1064(-)
MVLAASAVRVRGRGGPREGHERKYKKRGGVGGGSPRERSMFAETPSLSLSINILNFRICASPSPRLDRRRPYFYSLEFFRIGTSQK